MAAVGLDTSQTASQDSGYLSVGPSHGPNLSLPTPQHPATKHSDALTSSTPCDEPPLARTRPFPLSLLSNIQYHLSF